MFNPIYNKDGHLSYFRVACLFVAFTSFVTGCVMHHEEVQSVNVTNEDASLNNTAEVAEPVEDEESSSELRALAVAQLHDATEYLQTCGTLDNAYDNCSFKFADKLNQYYHTSLDASADGFYLAITAKDNNSDVCRLFEVDSNGNIQAFNKEGSEDKSCLSGFKNDVLELTILRDTDNRQGQVAPSGLSPIGKNLSSL